MKVKKRGGAEPVQTISVFSLAALCMEYLSACGYEFEQCAPSIDIAEEIEANTERGPISKVLSCAHNDFSERNFFWLVLRHRGQIVGTLGARIDDAGKDGLCGTLSRIYGRHYSVSGTQVSANNLPLVDATNSVSYMGDVFFAKGHRGDIAKTQCFCQLAFCIAFTLWSDRLTHIYALHRQVDVLRGKVDQYGFSTARYPSAQIWKNPPPERSNAECLSILSRSDFERSAQAFVMDPDALLKPPVRTRSPGATILQQSSSR